MSESVCACIGAVRAARAHRFCISLSRLISACVLRRTERILYRKQVLEELEAKDREEMEAEASELAALVTRAISVALMTIHTLFS